MNIYEIIMLILTVLFGALSLYLKTKTDLTDMARKAVADAEEKYKDSSKAGGKKFMWVVNTLYNYVPAPLKMIFTRETIESLVQRTFDAMEQYAVVQLDKVVGKITGEDSNNTPDK